MARKVFYSFHFDKDHWRAGQVRNIGVVEGNEPVSDNDWEEVKKKGDDNIKKWINDQLSGRSCTVVLIGQDTAGRKWINYEIKKSWEDEKGVVGIYIHGLKNEDGETSSKGDNPFAKVYVDSKTLSDCVTCHNPKGNNSKEKYDWIKENLKDIVEEAIEDRKNN